MKLIQLLAALGLVGLVSSCNAGPAIQGCDRPDIAFNPCSGLCEVIPFSCSVCEADPLACDPRATAGGSGGGGSSGGGDGACTNPADAMTYANLTYTNAAGAELEGSEAASAIASDCVFGSFNSVPQNPGCGTQAQAVLLCADAGCPQETLDALTVCVVECTQGLIEEVTGSALTQACADCYGESVSCSSALCATSGCANPTSTTCVECRCINDCTPGFDRCSGLPPSGACD